MSVKDLTLYRVLSFLLVPAHVSEAEVVGAADKLHAALNHFARLAGLTPPDSIAYPQRLIWQRKTLWDTRWAESSIRGLNVSAFAQTRHSDGVLLLAVEQDGPNDLHLWLPDAVERSEQIYGKEEDWHKMFAFPGDQVTHDRLRITGQAWLYTAEWDARPGEGWEAYAREHYDHGAYHLLPWGVLGYRREVESDALPVFELHVEASLSAERDRFLYDEMLLLLIDFLKVSQFVWRRYQKYAYRSISELEGQLIDKIESEREQPLRPMLRVTEESVRSLSRLLHEYSKRIAELAEDVHTIATDSIAVKDALIAAGIVSAATAPESFILSTMRRIESQLASDLEYFRITERQAERYIGTLQILVDIERARGENRLVVIGIILATLIGFSQLLPDKYPRLAPEQYGGLIRLIISLAICTVAVICYYWWQHRNVPKKSSNKQQSNR